MKYLVRKDNKNRLKYKKQEINNLVLKSLLQDESINVKDRLDIYKTSLKSLRRNTKVRITNRCILTGRKKSTLRMFRISRIQFRDLASQGYLAGIRKAS